MKRSITLSAVCLLMGMGVCLTASAKPRHHHMKMHDQVQLHEQVSLIPLRQDPGFAVMVDKNQTGNAMVIIYDNDEYPVFKDRLTKGTRAEKKYILSELDAGNYTLEVFSKGHDVKTRFYVYNRGEGKVIHLD